MYDRPPLLALEYFVATARSGTIRAAAHQLHITPSAVSHQIGKLEDFLNTQLFHRHKQRLVLTEAGHHYLEQLSGALNQIGQATRDVSRRDRRQYLRISVPPTFLIFFLIPRLPSLLERHPELTLSFDDSLILDPMREDIDGAIEYRLQTDERLRSTKLFDDNVVAISSPAYAQEMQLHSLEDIKRCMLIETKKRVFSWDSVLREFPWRAQCRMLFVQYTYQAMSSVALGHGVALTNRYNADHLLREGRLIIPFDIKLPNYNAPSYYFSTLPQKEARPEIKAFRAWIDEQIAGASDLSLTYPENPPSDVCSMSE
jgi:LysR family glycine cleavage system transcriptional activator